MKILVTLFFQTSSYFPPHLLPAGTGDIRDICGMHIKVAADDLSCRNGILVVRLGESVLEGLSEIRHSCDGIAAVVSLDEPDVRLHH